MSLSSAPSQPDDTAFSQPVADGRPPLRSYDEIERSIKVHLIIATRWLHQLPAEYITCTRDRVTEYISDIGQTRELMMAMRATFDTIDPMLNHRAANALHSAQVVQGYDLLAPIVDRIIDDLDDYRNAHAITTTIEPERQPRP